MSAIASPEFVSLCHAQLRLLTQHMAESTAALYIADLAETTIGKPSHFIPVVSYPDPVDSWTEHFSPMPQKSSDRIPLALPGTSTAAVETPPDKNNLDRDNQDRNELDKEKLDKEKLDKERPDREKLDKEEIDKKERPDGEDVFNREDDLEKRLVVPLIYTDVVVGLLVAIRRDRPWRSKERSYVETMADSLAAGCVLERRNLWLQSSIAHRRGLQSRQSEVFHNLLHQFRNPLTAVNTFGKLLVKRLGPNDPNQTVAAGIVRETSRLRELVTHFDEAVAIGDAELQAATPAPLLSPEQPLLPQASSESAEPEHEEPPLEADRSQIEHANRTELDNSLGHALTLSRQSLADVIDPILEVACIVAAEKGVRLYAQISRNTPWVWGEEEALSEVVSNLVDNAVKYSPPGAQVWVQTGVSRIEGNCPYQGIVIADTGPGIPASDIERLFERYYRGVQAQGELPGTGLGLAIAQSLVQEMQGAIEVISPALGTPWLPKAVEADSEESAIASSIASSGPGTVFIVWLQEAE